MRRSLRKNQTPTEQILWQKLRDKQLAGLKIRRQHSIGPYVVDFFCFDRALVIELDGDVHVRAKQKVKDEIREAYLKNLGLNIVRFTNNDIRYNVSGVLERLIEITNPHLSPLPPGRGEK